MRNRPNTYIIGEIGQNHNGSMDIAKLIMDAAARPIREEHFGIELPRMNAVKLTKRDLAQELSASEMERPYDSPHSFGRTYGEHRAKLELNDEQHFELYTYAKSLGFDFVETLCALGCLSMLKLFKPDRLKVASRDLTNLPLLNALAETRIPMIVSTGMADKRDLGEALEVIGKHHNDVAILHCVSEYPTHPNNANLLSIRYLQRTYPTHVTGYSDHTIGISAPVAAVAMGAAIIEKHITLDRRMKGTDQAGSLGPDGVARMVRDIRLMEMSFGEDDLFLEPAVRKAKEKLERSIATKRPIRAGQVIAADDLHLLSPGNGLRWNRLPDLVGKRAVRDIGGNELIKLEDIDALG